VCREPRATLSSMHRSERRTKGREGTGEERKVIVVAFFALNQSPHIDFFASNKAEERSPLAPCDGLRSASDYGTRRALASGMSERDERE
jgi:hypothetical protein